MKMHLLKLSDFAGHVPVKDVTARMMKRAGTTITAISVFTISALIAGCGGGGGGTSGAGVSPQAVSGVAATGVPLVGQVTLKDSSSAQKSAVISADGSFSVDVTDMHAPFVLKATGTAEGVDRTLFSFADKAGTANINPLSTVAVANAAGVNDPATVFNTPDAATLDKVKAGMPGAVAALQSQLKPLLDAFNAAGTNPVTDSVPANGNGLDGVFDNVKVTLIAGTLTITNATTGAILFTAQVKDIAHGHLTGNSDDMPKHGPRPAAPANVKLACGGDTGLTVSWDPVANATSYDLFYSTQSRVAEQEDSEDVEAKRVKNVTSPFALTGLTANTTYFVMVRAINDGRRGPPSAEVSMTTTTCTTSTPVVPAAPANVTANGGIKQTTLTWAAVSGATSYNLYWSTTTGVTTANGTRISNVTSPAIQTGLADSTTYFYILTAVNSAGESVASAQVAATTLAANSPPPSIPAAPTSISATGGDNQVTVSWSAVTGATSYNVYWSTTSGVTSGTGTLIASVTSPFVHTGRSASATYFYVVTAVNSAGESAPSVQTSATTNAATPAAINGATLYLTSGSCVSCHNGSLDPANSSHIIKSAKQGASAGLITTGIATVGSMSTRFNATTGTVIKLTPEQITAIATALQ